MHLCHDDLRGCWGGVGWGGEGWGGVGWGGEGWGGVGWGGVGWGGVGWGGVGWGGVLEHSWIPACSTRGRAKLARTKQTITKQYIVCVAEETALPPTVVTLRPDHGPHKKKAPKHTKHAQFRGLQRGVRKSSAFVSRHGCSSNARQSIDTDSDRGCKRKVIGFTDQSVHIPFLPTTGGKDCADNEVIIPVDSGWTQTYLSCWQELLVQHDSGLFMARLIGDASKPDECLQMMFRDLAICRCDAFYLVCLMVDSIVFDRTQ